MWRPPAPGSHASHGPFGELSPLLLTQCQVGADNTTGLGNWLLNLTCLGAGSFQTLNQRRASSYFVTLPSSVLWVTSAK